MKKRFTTIAISASISALVSAQNPRYTAAMEALVNMIDTAKVGVTYIGASNAFERIAVAEKKEWLPYYYAAYTQVQGSYMGAVEKNKVDDAAERADGLIAKADSLNPNNSEIYTVKGQINQLRIQVNPMMRGKKYGTIAGVLLDKAATLDPSNPRPHHLTAISLLYRPAMFGGGKDKACVEFQKAKELFDAAKPADKIAPHWGAWYNTKMITENCTK